MGARSVTGKKKNTRQKLAQTSIRAISALCRMIPVNKSKLQGPLVDKSLALKSAPLDYSFRCRRAGVRWSAEAFPDILTRHMMFEGMYQQDVLVALKALINPGDTIFDIGGHHGLMAVVSGKATGPSGRVFTFEPNPESQERIRQHVMLNGLRNVAIENIAISDTNGEATFYCQSGDVSWNSTLVKEFAEAEGGEGRSISDITVKTEKLDAYVERTGNIPNLIKIDTEGSEFSALTGAAETVRKYRPALIMELNPASAKSAQTSVPEYVQFLSELGYDLRVPKRNVLGFYNFKRSVPFTEEKHAANFLTNVVCVPRERKAAHAARQTSTAASQSAHAMSA
jgi:FkbM family methyltransferase